MSRKRERPQSELPRVASIHSSRSLPAHSLKPRVLVAYAYRLRFKIFIALGVRFVHPAQFRAFHDSH
jgi:hypothetical protein